MDITHKKIAVNMILNEHSSLSVIYFSMKLKVTKLTVAGFSEREKDTGEALTMRRGRCGIKRRTTAHDKEVFVRNSIIDPTKASEFLQKDLSIFRCQYLSLNCPQNDPLSS